MSGVVNPTEIHYALLDVVKARLGIKPDDDSMDDTLEIFIEDTDNWINNKLRAKLGTYDHNGRYIDLPLTINTVPPLEQELRMRASHLAVGKYRKETSNEETILKEAERQWKEYADRVFGVTRNKAYMPIPKIIISPISGQNGVTTVTISGVRFAPNRIIIVSAGGLQVNTSPAQIVTDMLGTFTSSTFTIPVTSVGPIVITAVDGTVGPYILPGQVPNTTNQQGNFASANFLVTS